MSLSNHSQTPPMGTGRVFMGADSPGPDEMSIQEIEGKRKLIWDGQTDEEYLQRVRTRAQDMARDVLAKAMAEAQDIKSKAHAEGLEQGLAEGQARVDAYVAQLAADAEGVLTGVQAQARDIWTARGDDCTALVRVVVEKVLGIEMAERRQEILHALLAEALDRLDSQRRITVRVNPQDADLVNVLLTHAQATNPGLENWRIKGDAGIELGGVILETPDGRVENTLDARWQAVSPLLEELGMAPPAQTEPPFTAPPVPETAPASQPEPAAAEPETAASTESPEAETASDTGADTSAPLSQEAVEAMLAGQAEPEEPEPAPNTPEQDAPERDTPGQAAEEADESDHGA